MKGPIGIAAAVIVALGSLGVSYWAFFLRADPTPPAPVAAEPLPVVAALTIAEMNAPVEIAGPDGVYRAARVGDRLSATMRIRTGDAGSATLRATDGSTVKLLGATSARVEALGRELQKLSLGEGMVEAHVRDDPSRLLELDLDDPSAAPGDAPAARTHGASFVASTDGAGRAAVATRRGEVILSARGKEVTILTGQVARVQPGETPSAPVPIPASLFLKVAWPGASRVPTVVVAGETNQGARVKVEGRYVRVAPDGKYRTELKLSEGEHQLKVETTDVAGRTKSERSPPILIDSSTDFIAHPPKWKH